MTFKLQCMASTLSAALAAATTVTDHGVKVPIIKAIRIEVANGQGELISTNTDQAVRTVIAADGEGVVHLDALALNTKIKALRQTVPVTIEGDEKAVTIAQGRTKWKLPAVLNSGFDFQAAAARVDGEAMDLNIDQFAAALRAVQPAFHDNNAFQYLMGASLEFYDGGLWVVGTDTHILHAVQIPGKWPSHDGMLVPIEAVNALSRLFAPGTVVKMIATPNAFTLDDGDTLFRSKMIEGKFIDWRRILPPADGSILIDAAELMAAMERVSAIREDEGKKARFVPVTMTISDAEITFASKNRDGEEGADFCACERIAGDGAHVIHFSAAMLMTSLRSFGPIDTVRLEFTPELFQGRPRPLVLHRHASATADFRLVNPMLG